jgi:methyl-accepting chemotaxis protein
VTQLDQMTQQNAALVEQSSAAAESLRDQAHQLADVVSVFKVSGAAGLSLASSASCFARGVNLVSEPQKTNSCQRQYRKAVECPKKLKVCRALPQAQRPQPTATPRLETSCLDRQRRASTQASVGSFIQSGETDSGQR